MLDASTIHGFVQSCLQRKFDQPVKTPDCHLEWWELCCSEQRQIAIAAPRKHAKSTAITFSYALAALLFREYKYLVIVSDTETQSSLFLGNIKQELIENEDLIALFGIKGFPKLTETDIIVEMDDGHTFRVMAKGAEQKLRGLNWKGKRPDLIICDDMENDEAVMNGDRREKLRTWFYGALRPARAVGGKIIVVGTILHMDSLLERLMPPLTDPTTRQTELKDYQVNNRSTWVSVKYRAHNSDYSAILWPEQWPKEALIAEKNSFIEQGLQDVYSREYLNYPIDERMAYFRREDFLPLREDDVEALENGKTPVLYYTGVDFAISTKERSDYTVLVTVGVNTYGEILVCDVRRGRWDAVEIIEEMFTVQRRFKPEIMFVEQGAIQKALGPFLNKTMMERGVYLNLMPMQPSKDKLSRARSIQARMRAGGIRFKTTATWYPYLEDEMARFPKDRHDDQVDALSWIGLGLDRMVDAPTNEELEQEEYEAEYNDSYAFQGRSPSTGY